MEEQGCPRCKTTKYRNPSLKLLVNVCGHSLCENCVELLFIKGSGACPDCGTALRRNNFRLQLFEDASVEKEVDIRKRILRDYNKKEEDFDSLNDYNDYLEMIETIVFNLTNGVDLESTKKQIEQYKRDNKEQIQRSRLKMSRDEEHLDMLIEHEKQKADMRKHLDLEEELREKNIKQKNKQALIDELMFSDMPASDIVAIHKHDLYKDSETSLPKAATKFSTGIKWGIQEQPFLPIPEQKEAEPYSYSPVILEMCGPDLPSKEDVKTNGYLAHTYKPTKQEKGGGYDSLYACHRALQDALAGLFYFPEVTQTVSSLDSSANQGSGSQS